MQEPTAQPSPTQARPEASPRPVRYQAPRLVKQGQWQAITLMESMGIGLQ